VVSKSALVALVPVSTGQKPGWPPKADLDMVAKRKTPFIASVRNLTPVVPSIA